MLSVTIIQRVSPAPRKAPASTIVIASKPAKIAAKMSKVLPIEITSGSLLNIRIKYGPRTAKLTPTVTMKTMAIRIAV